MDKIRAEIEQVLVFVDLEQCQIEDAPLDFDIEEEEDEYVVKLEVILKDNKGQPICNAANILTIGITAPNMTNVDTSIRELGDGKYLVFFTPVTHDNHTVSIQINSMHISKSPMNINVAEKTIIPSAQDVLF